MQKKYIRINISYFLIIDFTLTPTIFTKKNIIIKTYNNINEFTVK